MITHSKSGVRYLTIRDYQTKPWKNGKGMTHDIFLSPENSDHSGFDLRFALSPITEAGPFSSFPGADRIITLIEGRALELDFDGHIERLEPLQSLRFDTGLAPMGHPVGGPVRVVNVMARRGVWDIESCAVVDHATLCCGSDELLFLIALSEGWCVGAGADAQVLEPLSTVIVTDQAEPELTCRGAGHALIAQLRRHS